jgi:hypothetical protein
VRDTRNLASWLNRQLLALALVVAGLLLLGGPFLGGALLFRALALPDFALWIAVPLYVGYVALIWLYVSMASPMWPKPVQEALDYLLKCLRFS